MFLPLYDGKPVRFIRLQFVTLTLVAINIAVFLVVNVADIGPPLDPNMDGIDSAAIAFGTIPSVLTGVSAFPASYDYIPGDFYWPTIVTSAFLHADFWQLAGNMLFLWVCGDNVEDAMGHVKFLIFYLLSLFAAVAFHTAVFPASNSPLIGASGAVSGVIGAYIMLHPKMRIWGLFLRFPIRVAAFWGLGGWIAFQAFMFFADEGGPGNAVAFGAHLGGVLAGVLLVTVLKRRDVPLFDREIVLPEAVVLEPDAELPAPVKRPRFGRDAA